MAGAALACGGDDDSGANAGDPSGGSPAATNTVATSVTPVVTPSTGGTAGGPGPLLPGPASKYTPSEQDLANYYRADSANALFTNDQLFGQVGPFKSAGEGQELAKAWGYQEGYMVGFDPEGLLSSVVRGNYYVTVEAHLFETIDGAEKAYRQYLAFYRGTPGVQEQEVRPLGNESSGWRAVGNKLGETQIDAVYHRFVLRRGNLVIQVETLGGLPFMTIDAAREVAIIMDDRALGARPAPVPTISGLPTPAGGTAR